MGITGTNSVTLPAFWNLSTSRMLRPLARVCVRPVSTTSGSGPVSSSIRLRSRVTPPAGSVTEVAVPGADMLTRRSFAPVLTMARNTLAEPPAGSDAFSGAPSTNTLRIAMKPRPVAAGIALLAPATGGCQCSTGAFRPASHPASSGMAAAATRAQARRAAMVKPWPRSSMTCSPQIFGSGTWDAGQRIGIRDGRHGRPCRGAGRLAAASQAAWPAG